MNCARILELHFFLSFQIRKWYHPTLRNQFPLIPKCEVFLWVYTPLNQRFASESRPSQKEIHLPTIHFQVPVLLVSGGTVTSGWSQNRCEDDFAVFEEIFRIDVPFRQIKSIKIIQKMQVSIHPPWWPKICLIGCDFSGRINWSSSVPTVEMWKLLVDWIPKFSQNWVTPG